MNVFVVSAFIKRRAELARDIEKAHENSDRPAPPMCESVVIVLKLHSCGGRGRVILAECTKRRPCSLILGAAFKETPALLKMPSGYVQQNPWLNQQTRNVTSCRKL
jgi:hypothetical protein